MTQGERIREIRKYLGLTLERFGAKIGVTKTAISRIENGERGCTEQMTKSICREFEVDYIWLTTGEGEMFIDSDNDIIESIDRIMTGENEFHKNLFKTLAKLDENELFALESMIEKYLKVNEAKS